MLEGRENLLEGRENLFEGYENMLEGYENMLEGYEISPFEHKPNQQFINYQHITKNRDV